MGKRNEAPEFVRLEADMRFAGRHGTEQGDDPVFDELLRYAADLRKTLREIVICNGCNTRRIAEDPAAYQRNVDRYNAALKTGRRLLRKRA